MPTITATEMASPSFRPLYERILVRLDEPNATYGAIIIPEAHRPKATTGTIVRLGDGEMLPDGSNRPLPFRIGERVLFRKEAVVLLKVEGETFGMLHEPDVLACLDHDVRVG